LKVGRFESSGREGGSGGDEETFERLKVGRFECWEEKTAKRDFSHSFEMTGGGGGKADPSLRSG
jgi:hypothetical protein